MPDTIAHHSMHLLQTYARAKCAAEKIASAHQLVNLALQDASMLLSHRKHLLKLAQWWVTEADGKWRTRFRSQKVVELARTASNSQMRINHEHVFGRAALADLMLTDPKQAIATMELCVGCIVTVEEHAHLTAQRGASGWERYRRAKVVVLDAVDWEVCPQCRNVEDSTPSA